MAMPETFFCDCGKPWPCFCPQGRRRMEIKAGPPAEQDDDCVVGAVECPRCHEEVLLEFDPSDVICWEEDTHIVNEVGPAQGECCDLVFVQNLDGTVCTFDPHAED